MNVSYWLGESSVGAVGKDVVFNVCSWGKTDECDLLVQWECGSLFVGCG